MTGATAGGNLDPITLSVLVGALQGIAEEMGTALVRSAYSSNIKERRDCSAALFDARGRMVAQAEHIPVHLGAMPEAVAAVMARRPALGDVYVVNDPYSGGNHLPDITIVSPLGDAGALWGYAVTRAHHSDIGGMQPGSMPAGSRDLYSEGLVIPPVRLVRGGVYVPDVLDLILANTRTPRVRRGDFRAQIAANRLAQDRLAELVRRRGPGATVDAFDAVIAYTERRTREALRGLPDGVYRAASQIEGDGVTGDDIPLAVAVRIDGDRMHVDFTGTSPAVDGNVNCPLSVTRSACYFALRVLLSDDVPANAGTYAPLTIHAPAGSLVNAAAPSAVVAGNVETSQRLADTVLAALRQVAMAGPDTTADPPGAGDLPGADQLPGAGDGRESHAGQAAGPRSGGGRESRGGQATAGRGALDRLPAGGQGTMNNVNIGGRGWTYYETIGGGQGASRAGPGPSGVHVGMSNTLNTPVEAFELEYPMQVERFELAEGSGGDGAHRGGDGIVRVIRVLEPATLSLLTDRRTHPPEGAAGGSPGACGRNELDGEELPAKVSRALAPGSVVTITTPGGGGYGPPGG